MSARNFTDLLVLAGACLPLLGLPAMAEAKPKKPVLGFYASWAPPAVRYDKITHLMYAFLLPGAGGSISGSVPPSLVATAHAAGVKVIASIGGANHSEPFASLAASAAGRTAFANACKAIVDGGVDGVDIDWEYPQNAADSGNFTKLLLAVRGAIGTSKLLSLDLAPNDEKGMWVSRSAIDIADFYNCMAYDFTGSFPGSIEGQHSSYQQAVIGINYWWRNRGVDKEKVIMGVPFYGKNFSAGGAAVTYKDIVAANPGLSPDADQVGRTWFNGPATIKKKATFVAENGYGGIMIWELGQDAAPGAKSLLDAIEQGLAAQPITIIARGGSLLRGNGGRGELAWLGLPVPGSAAGSAPRAALLRDLNGRGFAASHGFAPAAGAYATGFPRE